MLSLAKRARLLSEVIPETLVNSNAFNCETAWNIKITESKKEGVARDATPFNPFHLFEILKKLILLAKNVMSLVMKETRKSAGLMQHLQFPSYGCGHPQLCRQTAHE